MSKKHFFINSKKVVEIKFKDGTTVNLDDFEIEEIEVMGYNNSIEFTESSPLNSSTTIIQGKNIMRGVNISTKGDFHLGDK